MTTTAAASRLRPHRYLLQRVDVAQRADQASRALVRLGFWRTVAGARRGAVGALCGAARAGSLALGVQGLGDAGRPARVAEAAHFDLEAFLAARDLQRIADADRARGLRALATDLDLAGFDGLLRQAARPEEARGPQPDIDADAGGRGVGRGRHGQTVARRTC